MSDAELPINHNAGVDVSTPQFYPGSATSTGALGLMNPDSMLGGTLRGTQFVGSNTLQIDSTQNLITIKNSAAAVNQTGVLRVGTVAQNYLGMAVNNGTVDTMFAGQDSSGATVIKIAKSGFDAKTATSDQLVFNSNQNMFKVILTGTTTLVVPNSMTSQQVVTVSIAHGLSMQPAFQVYGIVPASYAIGGSGQLTNLPIMVGLGSGVINLIAQASTDSTNLNISVINNYATTQAGVGAIWTFRYYVYQETAAVS